MAPCCDGTGSHLAVFAEVRGEAGAGLRSFRREGAVLQRPLKDNLANSRGLMDCGRIQVGI